MDLFSHISEIPTADFIIALMVSVVALVGIPLGLIALADLQEWLCK